MRSYTLDGNTPHARRAIVKHLRSIADQIEGGATIVGDGYLMANNPRHLEGNVQLRGPIAPALLNGQRTGALTRYLMKAAPVTFRERLAHNADVRAQNIIVGIRNIPEANRAVWNHWRDTLYRVARRAQGEK